MERTGSLHLLRLGTDLHTGKPRYSITYAPYDRRGGALPARLAGSTEELRGFLSEIHCDAAAIEQTVDAVEATGRASLPNVILSDDDLRRYGLMEMGIVESIISYLST